VRKRKLIPLLIALALVAALGVMLYLRAKAPPEAARLLPESDAILFVQLKDVRAATHFDQTPTQRSPGLQRFIDATGIVPERDIDAAALALHRVPFTAAGRPAADLFTSEVFVGRFDGQRLTQYLDAAATARETYAGRTVYSIPLDDQTLRVAQLGYDTVAASNMPTSEQIHSMLDRARASALGTPGSSLLAARFHDVPLLAQAWGIGHIGLPFAHNGHIAVLGLSLPLPEDSDLVASLRYNGAAHLLAGGSVQLRITDIAPSPEAAAATVDSLNVLLSMVRSVGGIDLSGAPPKPSDDALRAILLSTKLSQHGERAVLDADATVDQIKTLFKDAGNSSR